MRYLLILAAGLVVMGCDDPEGTDVEISAEGAVQVETGPFYEGQSFTEGSGSIDIKATDFGGRVSPLPPHDELKLDAQIDTGEATIEVVVRDALIEHPLGAHTTWWGVGIDVAHHGDSGIGSDRLPSIESELAAFGLGEITVDGELIAAGVPVHVMTAESGIPGELELDVGFDEGPDIPGLPGGHLRVIWPGYDGHAPEEQETARYVIGLAVLTVLLGGAIGLVRREYAGG